MPTMTAMLNEEALNLQKFIGNLPSGQQEFAQSLCEQQLKGKKPLSEKQVYWLGELFKKATAPKSEQPKVRIGDVSGIIALFQTAGSKLKYPTIVIDPVEGVTLKLFRAGAQAKQPGSVTVKVKNDYGEYDWLGRVTLEGDFEHGHKAASFPFIEDFLVQFAENPAQIAAEYGRKTGRCCFCNSGLTDERSLHVGYGPTCADHFGLPYPKKSELH